MAKIRMLEIPDAPDLLAAWGAVTLRHEHLTYVLRMTIKSLLGVDVDSALDATEQDGAWELRRRIKTLARKRLGEGEPLVKLQAILTRCGRVTERRNELLHGIWARDLDGDSKRHVPGRAWQRLPTVGELNALAEEIKALQETLNEARLEGFLKEAIAARPS